MRARRLLTAGEAFEDLIFVGLDRLPGPGEEVKTDHFTATIGGGAVITAIAAARLGLPVTIASGLGPAAVTRLRREGVRIRNLRRPGEPHAITAALSTTSDRAFVTFNGVNADLEPRLTLALGDPRAAHVHLAFFPKNCARWTTIVRRLKKRGHTTSWDFGWNEPLLDDKGFPDLLAALDLVFLNEHEARLYARTKSLDAALKHWRAQRGKTIVKLGDQGSRWLGDGADHSAQAPKVKAIDTTGAGDAFNGGFLWAWLRCVPPKTCLAAGNAVGAASTTKAGGVDALPRLQDLPGHLRS